MSRFTKAAAIRQPSEINPQFDLNMKRIRERDILSRIP